MCLVLIFVEKAKICQEENKNELTVYESVLKFETDHFILPMYNFLRYVKLISNPYLLKQLHESDQTQFFSVKLSQTNAK